jgi:hypothetical protein
VVNFHWPGTAISVANEDKAAWQELEIVRKNGAILGIAPAMAIADRPREIETLTAVART